MQRAVHIVTSVGSLATGVHDVFVGQRTQQANSRLVRGGSRSSQGAPARRSADLREAAALALGSTLPARSREAIAVLLLMGSTAAARRHSSRRSRAVRHASTRSASLDPPAIVKPILKQRTWMLLLLALAAAFVMFGSPLLGVIGSLKPPSALVESAAGLCALFFFLSPAVQMRKVFATDGAELDNVSPQTMILMFFNCALWSIWGIFSPMWPAVPPNAVGFVAAIGYLSICWGFALRQKSSTKWGKGAALGTAGVMVLNIALAFYGSASPDQAQQVGFLAMFVCIVMFAAPLSDLGAVIKNRNSECLPLVQCAMQFIQCALWLIVGLDKQALQVIVCNGLGITLASIQLGLIALYPAAKSTKALL
mmetsp:Transcript_150980/g.485199  ORF Transcript_150980/g.485199 Transcript_150980/m.485199 type:complete len:366 (-) Transcript_150980:486-1583(-)